MKQIFVVILILVFCGSKNVHAKNFPGKSIYNLKETWSSQSGETQSLDSLQGKVQVLAMIYTHCESACPMIVEYMKKIEHQLPSKDQNKVGFVLFSIDSKKDDSKSLRAFAKAHGLNLNSWSLYSSKSETVRELAAALGFSFKEQPDGNFAHQNMISVLDEEGIIVKQNTDLNVDASEILKVISTSIAASKK